MNSRKRSDRLTAKVAKRMGGRCTPNSGARWHSPGDIDHPNWKVEHKFTKTKSFSVTTLILDKIRAEAFRSGKNPALVVEFVDTGGAVTRSVAVIDLNTFNHLIKESDE